MVLAYDRPQLQRIFQRIHLERVATELTALAQDAVALHTLPIPETLLPPRLSRLGGVPDLPHGLPWPDWNGVALAFCAQIALLDVLHQARAAGLPERGLLSFFVDPQQRADGSDPTMRDGWRVLFFPEGMALLPRPAPSALPLEGRFAPMRVMFYAGLSLPPDPALRNPALQLTDAERERYEQWFASQQSSATTPRHQLFGEPTQLQDDLFLTCTQAAPGLRDPAHAAQDWQLLLQLDSDERSGMRWGSAGMLSFLIERTALAAMHCDQAWAVIQSD